MVRGLIFCKRVYFDPLYRISFVSFDFAPCFVIGPSSFSSATAFADACVPSLAVYIDPTPSVRHLCGGNILAIEKLLAFGKELQIMNKELAKERDSNEENDKLMRVS